MKFNSVVFILRNPQKLIRVLGDRNFFNWMDDETYLKLVFRYETGKKLDLKKPDSYNAKLQWLKLYNRKPEYHIYVDKYEVRKYIRDTIGEKYLIPLIGAYDNLSDIPWNVLPDRFVLKCTHGSSCNIICRDKSKLSIEESNLKLNRWMNKSWFWFGREWPYKNLKPRIICEEFISENGESPKDYKVFCFQGKAKLVVVHLNRFSGNHTMDYYDINWKKTSISKDIHGYPKSETTIPKPANLEQMIILSEKLSKDEYHIRIDWYEIGEKLYFGEITFFDGSGFMSFDKYEDDLMMGSWINLPTD